MNRPISILLIEDDPWVRQALGQALAVENYHVVPAANRQEALREFGNHFIDILLLDVNPWNENAWETVRRLTALRPHLPVIGMTARPEQHDSSALAVDALLEKPINIYSLIQILDQLWSQRPELRHRRFQQQQTALANENEDTAQAAN